MPVISEDPVIVDVQPTPAPSSKRVLDESEEELKKLKVTELQGVSKVRGHFFLIQINESFRNPILMKVFQFYVHCFL